MAVPALKHQIPPLVAGDHLDRAEFELRYEADERIKKAELIDGVVYVASPVSVEHADPHGLLIFWLNAWRMTAPGIRVLDNATLRVDDDNEPQPDAMLCRNGGGARVDEDGYVEGTPELVAEVAWSSSAYDLHQKKEVYRRIGVQTYVVYAARERRVRWFELSAGRYVEQNPDGAGVFRAEHLPGLWLDSKALIAGDARALFATLQEASGTG